MKYIPKHRLERLIPYLAPSKIPYILLEKYDKIEIGNILSSSLNRGTGICTKETIDIMAPDGIPNDILRWINNPEGKGTMIELLPPNFIYTEINRLTVPSIKLIAKRKGLKLVGKKEDIIKRIADSQGGLI